MHCEKTRPLKFVESQMKARKGAGTGSSFKEGSVKQVMQRQRRRASAAVLKICVFSSCGSLFGLSE